MSHTYVVSVRSTMSGIASINHSDCKSVHAWVTHRSVAEESRLDDGRGEDGRR